MTIKHLVLSGGGPIGFRFLGILEELNRHNYWSIEDIKTIHATSIGTIVGSFLCLKYDWETLNKYIIERPWNDVFKLNIKQILEVYYKKGLYDKKIVETVFKPLLAAKDLSLNITLKEFYEYSKIEFFLYTFELNQFQTVELSYKTHPDLTLIEAISMSCALPGIFIPICFNNGCYIDGGVMMNYPINYAVENYNEDEILALNYIKDSSNNNYIINEESTLLDFIIKLSVNAKDYIINTVKNKRIKNQIDCIANVLTLDGITEAINNMEIRKKWIEEGINDASEYLKKLI